MTSPYIDFTVFPDECDAFGHLNQAAFLSYFERARWEVLDRTSGMKVFELAGVRPVVRRNTIEYHAQALPGERLRFEQRVSGVGRTSFTVQQVARKVGEASLVATAEVVLVCIDAQGRPTPVPAEVRAAVSADTWLDRVTINGITIGYESRGEGPAVLCIHGYPLGGYLWRHQASRLVGHRVIVPDLRGLGQSGVADGAGRMAQYSDDLVALLDHLGVERATICGLSLGGYIAFDLLRRHRSRVSGVILASTRATAESEAGKAGREVAIAAIRNHGARAAAEGMVPGLFAPDASARIPSLLSLVRDRIAALSPAGLVQALEAMRDRSDSRDLLNSLGALPVLVLAGQADQMIPESDMRALATAIPGAVYRVIDGAGHLAPLEQPEATTAAIAAFLTTNGR